MYQIAINLLERCQDPHVPKVNLKKIFYSCYKNFDNENYEEEVKCVFIFSPRFLIFPPWIKNDSRLTCTFKQKAMRNSNQSFMTKTLGKAIMKKSKWKNKFNKERNDKNWFNYKQERNHCSNPFYIYETKNSNNILNENYETIREDEKICKIFYTYFTNVTKGLKFRQVDKTQSIENEGSWRVIKEHLGNRSF